MEDMASIMARASCDKCGVLFEILSDLQNHVRRWCYRGSDRKRPRFESESFEDEKNDNIAFINMANEVKKETEERFTAYVEKYQADGFTLKQAKEEAELVTLQGDRQVMFKKYVAFLKSRVTSCCDVKLLVCSACNRYQQLSLVTTVVKVPSSNAHRVNL